MPDQRQYIIVVDEHAMAIGPFPSEADAKTYLEQSGTARSVPILRLLPPVDLPTEDADLNP